MSNKVELVYDNNEYRVLMNGSEVFKDIDIENSYDKFRTIIRNNKSAEARAWEDILIRFESLGYKDLDINKEYKTLTFGDLKYFYNMGKSFFMKDGKMIPLIGGYEIFKFTLNVVSKGDIIRGNEFIEFCKEVVLSDVNYRLTDSSIIVASASFNYGSAEYNFISGKINKGASIIEGNLKEFKEYVFSIIKK
ncbi:hypothetical protein [Clostridium sp.]|uniref:hypothetical protein n=1 Tax=Clostridium sp. TaxID=1506 RepID=UPI00261248CF|nr:hypothetical protein [Clostridium sp.]